MMHKIKDIGLPRGSRVGDIYHDINAILEMARQDDINWLSTQYIIDCIGTDYGNHVVVILHVMYYAGVVDAASANDESTGKHCLVWRAAQIPF